MNTQAHICFIGAGNMAGSIVGGLVRQGYPRNMITLAAPSKEHLQHAQHQWQVNTTEDNNQAVQAADIIVLAVKPQVLREVCESLAPTLQGRSPLIISVAAGISTRLIQTWLQHPYPVVRTMPNTPALVLKGATGLFATEQVSAQEKAQAEAIFAAIGLTCWVEDEQQMHAITALSGSGPAYFFLILEALESAGVNAGLSSETARLLAIQTMAGAAEMARTSPLEPAQLKRNVMSPGGTTERAIEAFEAGGLRTLVDTAVSAAKTRSAELAEILGKG
ncbi:MAG: pyrroline-5-carboxylate reductase [Hahellaceae bacterium]|nr:pyrroline-5-carboxylate reductase [Hahellaceae bacterium]MCP5168423.1 pyrroline-5-carboxylate reductase [Hahellaceae bacterium]